MSEHLTHEMVTARFAQAADTLRRLPRVNGPNGHGSAWPAVVHDCMTAYGYTEATVRLPPPRPRAIDAMDEVFTWFKFFIDRDEALAVWLNCGRGMSLSQVARILGIHRETVRVKVFAGRSRIIAGLNAIKSCMSGDDVKEIVI